ncbi:MAG: hypothetical protein PHX83_00530 [Acidobacteriia bacterium]|nr:hypothetical protein [Terriglobia bacterium]
MPKKKSLPSWWRIREGKYIAYRFGGRLDAPTRALVRGMLDGDSMQRLFERGEMNGVEEIRIARTPLPFETIEEWLTWTVTGNNVNH